MRHNASSLYIVLLCGIALLSHSSVSAQTPQAPKLQGTYTLDATASDDVQQAIKTAVKGVNIFIKGRVHDYLTKTNVPYQRVEISYSKTEMNITTDRWATIKTLTNGTAVNWKRADGEKFKVSTVWECEKLKQTFKGENGQRVNTYSLSEDGKTLTMQVSVTSSYLTQPLTYKLVYKRTA